MKKRFKALTAMALVASVLLAGCGGGGGDTGGNGAAKDVLVASSYADGKNLNPYATDSRLLLRVSNQVFERLVDHNEAGDEFVPRIAESWDENKEGITFYIRKGIKFHEGQELTAEDVVYSLKMAAKYPAANPGWDWIDWENITAKDEYTVHIPYIYPCFLTLSEFACSNIVILCKETCEEYGDEISQHANGTGPFKVGEWKIGDHLNMDRFDDYWGEAPALKQIVLRFIPEGSQAVIELETGGVDLVLDVPPLEVDRLREADGMKVVEGTATVLDYLHLNTENEYFDDVRVRQAIAYALSTEDILQGVYHGVSEIAYSCIGPDIVGYNGDYEGENWPYGTKANIEKAKELLTEAGYADGFSVKMEVDEDVNRIAVSEVVRNNLEQIGIDVTIQSQDYATFVDKILNGKADLFMNGVNANSYEPDFAMYKRWHSSNAYDGGLNYTRYSNDKFDALLDEARLIPELKDRVPLYQEAQEIWINEVPSIPYYVRPNLCAANESLQGVALYGEAVDLTGCYFE